MTSEQPCVLQGFNVYLQTTATGSPGSPRNALKRKIEQLGARCTSRLGKTTTHVVYHIGQAELKDAEATKLRDTLSRVSKVALQPSPSAALSCQHSKHLAALRCWAHRLQDTYLWCLRFGSSSVLSRVSKSQYASEPVSCCVHAQYQAQATHQLQETSFEVAAPKADNSALMSNKATGAVINCAPASSTRHECCRTLAAVLEVRFGNICRQACFSEVCSALQG